MPESVLSVYSISIYLNTQNSVNPRTCLNLKKVMPPFNMQIFLSISCASVFSTSLITYFLHMILLEFGI
jgi:hypothetical protein